MPYIDIGSSWYVGQVDLHSKFEGEGKFLGHPLGHTIRTCMGEGTLHLIPTMTKPTFSTVSEYCSAQKYNTRKCIPLRSSSLSLSAFVNCADCNMSSAVSFIMPGNSSTTYSPHYNSRLATYPSSLYSQNTRKQSFSK